MPQPTFYDPRFGGIPQLPTSANLAQGQSRILNTAIPGFSNLTNTASSNIGAAMNGQLPPDVISLIKNSAAERAVGQGMPGSSNINGTLLGNNTLKTLGLTSLQRQDTGFKDLLSLLGGVSGTVAPTFGQAQEQGNAAAQYGAAPIPAVAQAEQERIYGKYAGGNKPWWGTGQAMNTVYENGIPVKRPALANAGYSAAIPA